ncbi:MAG: hypothetical protein HY348_02015 [Nitrospira defluvii]|nr:hypothetical protein [Nitrospira defluvii]
MPQGPFPNDFATWIILYAQDRLLGERLANEQEWEFLTRTMQAKCKAFGTTMEAEGQVGTISVK